MVNVGKYTINIPVPWMLWYGFYQQSKMYLMSEDASQFITMFLRKTNVSMEIRSCFEAPNHCCTLQNGTNREKIAAGLWFKVCLQIFGWWVHVTLSKVKWPPMMGNKEVTLNHLEYVSFVLKHVCDFRPLLQTRWGLKIQLNESICSRQN